MKQVMITEDAYRNLSDKEQAILKLPVFFDGYDNFYHPIRESVTNCRDILTEMDSENGIIEVILHDDNRTITIKDNGCGIILDGESNGNPNWEHAFLILFSGSKMSTGKTSGGTNGCGNTIINYSSDLMDIISKRNGKIYHIQFVNGGEISVPFECLGDTEEHGTEITFKLCDKIYTNTVFDENEAKGIVERIVVTSPNITSIFKYKDQCYSFNFKDLSEYLEFKEIKGEINNIVFTEKEYESEFYNIDKKKDDIEKTKINLLVNFSKGSVIHYPFLNGIYMPQLEENTVHKGVINGLKETINKYLKDNNMYDKGEKPITLKDVEESTSYICDINSTNVSYTSQTKFSTKKELYENTIKAYIKDFMEVYSIENKEDMDELSKIILVNKRAREKSEETRQKTKSKLSDEIKFTDDIKNFKNCITKDKDLAELYVGEGSSALGGILQSRKAFFQAGFHVGGKMLSLLKATEKQIFSNEVVYNLYRIFGCGTHLYNSKYNIKAKNKPALPNFNIDNFKWKRIVIATDQDIDAFQIRCLILCCIYRMSKELIEQGYIYIAEAPLYEITTKNKDKKKEETLFAYTDKEKEDILKDLDSKGIKYYPPERNKGLGQMAKETMAKAIMNPDTRRLTQVTVKDIEAMEKVFELWLGDNVENRREVITNNFDYVEHFDCCESKDVVPLVNENYLPYAIDIVKDRAIIAIDGFKPSHRKLLWTLHEKGLYDKRTKSANIVGDNMSYNVHGDGSIYQTLVRMAQDDTLLYPYVNGKGNFGLHTHNSKELQEAHMRYCLTGDTFIQTDLGLIELNELVANSKLNSESNIDIKVLSLNNKINSASKFFNSGIHRTKQITTSCGYSIQGSYNHPLIVLSTDKHGKPILKWTTIENLSVNDYLVINRNGLLESKEDKVSIDIAGFLGAMVSEGFISIKTNRIGFNNNNLEYTNQVYEWFQMYFGDSIHISEYYSNTKNGENKEICIHNKELCEHFISEFDFGLYSINRCIPRQILQSSFKIQSIFLKFLFEGDGSIVNPKNANGYISYSSSSNKLVKQIQIVLLQFGIYSDIKPDRDNFRLIIRGKHNLKLFKDNIDFAYERKSNLLTEVINLMNESYAGFGFDCIPYISNYIRKNNHNTFVEKHNFSNKDKFIKNKIYFNKYMSKEDFTLLEHFHDLNYLYLPIQQIKECDKEVVYCIRVDSDCHSFVANGFINHNTEAGASNINREFFKDINKNAVEFTPNFDGQKQEPTLLPTTFPNLLVNYNEGIAVGMASKTPSFNLIEVINTTIAYLQDKNINVSDYLLAPDFATKGEIIYDKNELESIYNTGKGNVTLRSKYKIVDNNIIITEIPYSTNVEAIVSRIKELCTEKSQKYKAINNVIDTTELEGISITIEVKKNTDMNKLMLMLYKETPLESKQSFNMNIICLDGIPRVLSIKQILDEWLEFRKQCIKNVLTYDITAKSKTLHLLKGLENVLLNVDRAIEINRYSEEDQVIPELMKEFNLDEQQGKYVYEMKLRNINEKYIENEIKDIHKLEDEIKKLQYQLDTDEELDKIIIKDLERVKKEYGEPRKTEIIYKHEVVEIKEELFIEEYTCTLVLSKEQYFKKTRRYSETQKLKDGDEIQTIIQCSNKDKAIFISNQGNAYFINLWDVNEKLPSAIGDYLLNMLPLEKNETIIGMLSTNQYKGYCIYIFENGKVLKTPLTSFKTKTNRTKLSNSLTGENGSVLLITQIDSDTDIELTDCFGKTKVVNTKDINEKQSRKSVGVTVWNSKKANWRLTSAKLLK